MTETLYYLTHFTSETLTISGFLLLLVLSLLVTFWFYNRKKFHQLGHQIPASVVKNYIDSIIQNSNSLKSSLFRGGGIELGNGIPSVIPINSLPMGTPVSVSGGGEELQQKNAEIASLHTKLAEKNRIVSDLERRISDLDKKGGGNSEEAAIYKSEVEKLQKKVEALQHELASAGNKGGGGDAEVKKQLESVTKERDELKERLKEYEIIEEDLANLKRLQQENEKLKKSLEAMGGQASTPAVAATTPAPPVAPAAPPPVAAPAAPVAAAPVAAAPPAAIASEKIDLPPADAVEVNAAEAQAISEAEVDQGPAKVDGVSAQNAGDQKSAEDLLSEFEKMLG